MCKCTKQGLEHSLPITMEHASEANFLIWFSLKKIIVINYGYSSKLECLCATQEAKKKKKKVEGNLLLYRNLQEEIPSHVYFASSFMVP